MTSSLLFASTTALVLVAGLLWQGERGLTRQRTQLAAAQQRTENLNGQLEARNRAREATVNELTLAEKQLAQLPPARTGATTGGAGSGETEFAAWIARVKRLQHIVKQRPDQRIPEMRVLTDDDWLFATRNRQMDSEEDIRRALAAVRTAAKDRFVAALAEAIKRFNTGATPDQTAALPRPGPGGATTRRLPPATVMDLAPYLQNPADAEVLSRLALFTDGPSWKLQEKDPIDPEDDGGYRITSDGLGSVSRAPWAWLPPDYGERSRRAIQAYQAAHNGHPPSEPAETLSYFDPPLEPATAEKIRKAGRDGVR